MKSEHTTVSLQMGMKAQTIQIKEFLLTSCSLLTSPFDYSQAFDRALKEVVKTLPNRPARETADDAVCISKVVIDMFTCSDIYIGLLLRLRRSIWRICLQPSLLRIHPFKSDDLTRGNRNKMLPCSP